MRIQARRKRQHFICHHKNGRALVAVIVWGCALVVGRRRCLPEELADRLLVGRAGRGGELFGGFSYRRCS